MLSQELASLPDRCETKTPLARAGDAAAMKRATRDRARQRRRVLMDSSFEEDEVFEGESYTASQGAGLQIFAPASRPTTGSQSRANLLLRKVRSREGAVEPVPLRRVVRAGKEGAAPRRRKTCVVVGDDAVRSPKNAARTIGFEPNAVVRNETSFRVQLTIKLCQHSATHVSGHHTFPDRHACIRIRIKAARAVLFQPAMIHRGPSVTRGRGDEDSVVPVSPDDG